MLGGEKCPESSILPIVELLLMITIMHIEKGLGWHANREKLLNLILMHLKIGLVLFDTEMS